MSYIYKDNDTIIAICLALYEEDLKQINISVLCVKSEYQRKGIGKSILNACIDNCIKKGYNEFNLHVCVTNEKAIKLYEKIGFTKIKMCENYYSEDEPPDNDAYFMELTKKKNEEKKEYHLLNVQKNEDNYYNLYTDNNDNNDISLYKLIFLFLFLL